MSLWHIPVDHIVKNWSYELLNLMVKKANDRIKEQNRAASGSGEKRQVTGRDFKPNWGDPSDTGGVKIDGDTAL